MGKVLASFGNVYPGAISRNVDDIVISIPNTGDAAIKFGDPVFFDSTNEGGRGWKSGDAFTAFLGIATRIGTKTPATYGGNEGQYEPGDVMSVIVRGSVCVVIDDSVDPTDAVYYDTTAKKFTSTVSTNLGLTNCKFRKECENYTAEIVITERNIM